MRAAIERRNGRIVSRNFFAAALGFRELGYDLLYFEWGQVEELPADPEIVVAGCIPSVRRALECLGCIVPRLPSIPAELEPFAGRHTWTSTLHEVRQAVQRGDPPCFIKPLPGQVKLFTGCVVEVFRDLIATAGVSGDTPVLCSEVVRFRSEYRGFVHHRRLVGFKHYSGDFRVVPDFGVVDSAVAAFTAAPVAYALDVGVTEDGLSLLVELNDGYALGAYGLDEVLYARFLADRWSEMVLSSAESPRSVQSLGDGRWDP